MSPVSFLAVIVLGLAPAPSGGLGVSEGRVDAGASGSTVDAEITNRTHIVRDMRRHYGETSRPSLAPCDQVLERLCAEGGFQVCQVIQREVKRRKFTERDQRECRQMLDDPAKFREVLATLQRRALRP